MTTKMGTTATVTTVLLTHEVTGSFTMNVSDSILDLNSQEQTIFTDLLEESIASLLNTSSDNVDGVVSNFLDSRRLSMLTHEGTVTLTRRLAGTDVSVSYTVRTTEDQVSSIIEGLTSTVATGLADHLTDAIATDGRISVTIFGVSDFSNPKSSLIGSSDTGVVTDMPITTSTVGLPITTTTMTITTTMITTMVITTTSTTLMTTELTTSIATTTAVIVSTTTTITTILVTHEVTGTFKLTVSADTLNLDANGQETFVNLLEASIAALLGISDAHVDAVVTGFNDNSRRLSMLSQESVLALVRRLTTASLDISYTVSTTGDQVSSITQGLTDNVQTNLADHLTAAIAADDSINVTVVSVTDFESPQVTVVSTGDDTVPDDDDDGLSTGIIVVIVLVCVLSLIIVVVLFVLYRRRSSQPKNVNPGSDAEQPSQVEAVEA